jgi:ATP/maltotriose-dependent transcriptional regulator MalT/two-component SAPR family response regulator
MPIAAGLLHRPRLCQDIERGLDCKLTVISAPAGYGKTSALIDFAQQSAVPVCWYTADERDRDLGTFVKYLSAAIHEQFGSSDMHLLAESAFDSDFTLQDPAIIAGEFSNWVSEVDTPFVLVVDNFEAVDGPTGIRAFMHRLLDVLPFNCHLMIGSRVLPDVPIARLVAKQQLVGLADRNLQFTPREIQGLFQLSQIEITEDQAATLAANSEGWITGILLLASRLRKETQEILRDGRQATTETYNYLIQEVLLQQPPDIQHFLYTSAILREVSPRLCRQILEINQPETLLAEIERRNLFVIRFGENGGATYRYHNLFRDFLLDQLNQRDPSGSIHLHRRAAAFFEEADRIEEAVYHYSAARAYLQATRLMERVALEWFTRGRVETLLSWASGLPDEVKPQAPRLLLYQSKVLTDRYDFEEARVALAHAEAGFAVRTDSDCLAKVHNQRATLAFFSGQYDVTIAEARTASGLLGQQDVIERAHALRHLGRAQVGLGQFNEGVDRLKKALALYRQVNSLYDVVNLLRDLVQPLTALGRLDEVNTYLNEALGIGRRLGAPTQLAGVLNELGWVRHLGGQYQDALALYEEGLAAARRGNDLRYQAYIGTGMADVFRDIGAYDRAEPLYSASWKIAREREPGLAVYILLAQADMCRWRDDHTQSLLLLDHARQLADNKELDYEKHGLLPLSEGITLVEQGEVVSGIQSLTKGIHYLEQRGAKRDLARAWFFLAQAHYLTGDSSQAILSLDRALSLAEEVGTCQFAVTEGQHIEGLLRLGSAEKRTACDMVLDRIRQLRAFASEQRRANIEAEPGAAGHLEIYTLGTGHVLVDGQEVPASEWRTATAKELFFYILFHGPLERDMIGATFWPELSAKRVTNRFHTALYRVRRALGSDAVVVKDGKYHLGNTDYWLDVDEFKSLIERARLLPTHDWQAENLWRRAVALYQGDFLPEAQQVWCVPIRETLWEMHIEALTGVGQCHEARGESEEAIRWYRRGLEIDELREDIHRRIMQCYISAGQRASALAQYHRCREALKREMNAEPSEETNLLYVQIAGKS